MELYIVTQSGTKVKPLLREAGRDLEADILDYLGKTDGATVEQVADALHLDEKTAYDQIWSLGVNRWVWRKSTKLAQF